MWFWHSQLFFSGFTVRSWWWKAKIHRNHSSNLDVFGVTLWPSRSSKSLPSIWRIMKHANLPSTVSTQSCRPRFSCGFITQWLLVAVMSNTSQPEFDAWIFLEPRRKVSASLKENKKNKRIKATQKQWQIIMIMICSKNNKNKNQIRVGNEHTGTSLLPDKYSKTSRLDCAKLLNKWKLRVPLDTEQL